MNRFPLSDLPIPLLAKIAFDECANGMKLSIAHRRFFWLTDRSAWFEVSVESISQFVTDDFGSLVRVAQF